MATGKTIHLFQIIPEPTLLSALDYCLVKGFTTSFLSSKFAKASSSNLQFFLVFHFLEEPLRVHDSSVSGLESSQLVLVLPEHNEIILYAPLAL